MDSGNEIELDDYIFSKALASKLPKHIQRWGEEYKATNILTEIDKVTVEHPNVRPMYDELSDVCHPNTHGVLWHFADLDEGTVTFDDVAKQTDAALGSLIFCSIMFVGEIPAISRLETKLAIALSLGCDAAFIASGRGCFAEEPPVGESTSSHPPISTLSLR